jgi:hypothetical protein
VPSRKLLVVVSLVALALVLAVGLSRGSVGGAPCPDRVWSAALSGLTDRAPDPCEAQALDRLYAVSAGVLGLVLISGLLSRRG